MSDSKLFSFISSCPESIKNLIASYLSCIDILEETTIKEEYKIFFEKDIKKELHGCDISEEIEHFYNLFYEKLILDLLISIEQQLQGEITFYTINFGQKVFSKLKSKAFISRIAKDKDGEIQNFLYTHVNYFRKEDLTDIDIDGCYLEDLEINFRQISLSIYTFLSTLLLKVYPLKFKIYQQISGS